MSQPSLSEILQHTLGSHRRNVEPVPRMCGGYGPRYVWHRFDIKGGISGMDLLAINVQQHNALFKRLRERHGIDVTAANTRA